MRCADGRRQDPHGHTKLVAARTPAERELYARQIEATDGEVDRLVYELYGLTEEEVAIVEGALSTDRCICQSPT